MEILLYATPKRIWLNKRIIELWPIGQDELWLHSDSKR